MKRELCFPAALFLASLCFAESASGYEVYSGTEARAGYRTDYLYNGVYMAKNVAEAQISAGFSLSSYCDFNFSGQGYQSLSDSFGNLGAYGELVFHVSDFRIKPFGSVNMYNECVLKSGVEMGLSLEQEVTKSWSWEISGLYDTGQEGYYSSLRIHYFPLITEDLGIRFTVGSGAGYDYFDVRGINEIFGRVSLPVRIGDSWVIEPFLGISDQHGRSTDKTRVYFGLWASFLY